MLSQVKVCSASNVEVACRPQPGPRTRNLGPDGLRCGWVVSGARSAPARGRVLERNLYHPDRGGIYSCTMDLTKRIGKRLRNARSAQQLSLAGLAQRTSSLSKSRISNYEQGIRRMGLEEAQELALALGTVSASYLLCLDDFGPLSDHERDLIAHYRRTDARGKDTILLVAESQASYELAEPSATDAPDTSQP
jgi:transcriptional regulator with XRE-family HTH domain